MGETGVLAVGAGPLTTGAFAAAFFAAHRAFNAAIRRLFPSGDMWPLRDAVSAHKTQAVKEFLEQNPRVRFHFTPTYSSWLNQVEIWFAKIERDVIARGVFTSVADLSRKLMKYIRLYAKSARPFRWKYTDVRRRIVTK